MEFHVKQLLQSEGYSCVIQSENGTFTSTKSGIAPLMDFISETQSGALEAADKVVGKSAALLMLKMGAKHIYGEVMSEHARKVLDAANVEYSYGKLVPYIVNRRGDGMCPMEEAVLQTDNPETAFRLLKEKLKAMRTKENKDGLEVLDYTGEGYNKTMHFDTWRVAYLNHGPRFMPENFEKLERHNLTDEVFVLLEGEAVLLIGEKAEKVKMEPFKLYNVKKGCWHHIFTKKGTRVLIVENNDTSAQNTDYLEIKETDHEKK